MKLSDLIKAAPARMLYDIEHPDEEQAPDFDPVRAYYGGFWHGQSYERGATVALTEVLEGLDRQLDMGIGGACDRFERGEIDSVVEEEPSRVRQSPGLNDDTHVEQAAREAEAIAQTWKNFAEARDAFKAVRLDLMQRDADVEYWKERAEAAERFQVQIQSQLEEIQRQGPLCVDCDPPSVGLTALIHNPDNFLSCVKCGCGGLMYRGKGKS